MNGKIIITELISVNSHAYDALCWEKFVGAEKCSEEFASSIPQIDFFVIEEINQVWRFAQWQTSNRLIRLFIIRSGVNTQPRDNPN